MSIKDAQAHIVEEFSGLQNWEQRYKKIIDLGKQLPDLDEKFKTDDLKVKGCQSQVWIHATLSDDKRVVFQADSDALIVRGLVALLLKVYSGATPEEILNVEPTFIAEIGLQNHLSPSRTNGLMSMIKQIKYYAAAFTAMLDR